VSFILGHSKP
jgi:hypothetical protein